MREDVVRDLFIIGGGINGCGIARDAAGRGYSVFLAEKDDLGSGTSSASTKLIHGGLRYLEYYEFRLVREALREREVLWRNAPHIIRPMRFVLPVQKGLRPAWLIRLGLFVYDHIGGRRLLPPTRSLDLRGDPAGKPLKPGLSRAFEYSDCWVDDARLVVLNARDAADHNAEIRTRTKVVKARVEEGIWVVTVQDESSTSEVRARMLVNAAGPWVDEIISDVLGSRPAHHVRLVKGSHIVVRRKFADPRAFFFQNKDGRIIFAIPYEGEFTLIGTTDQDFTGDPGTAEIDQREIAYLCSTAGEYFSEPVEPADIVWTYAGVRPLYDDGATKAQEATRDYVLKIDHSSGAPMLNVFGGKITTFRRLSETALALVGEAIGENGKSWTADVPLPGGDFGPLEFGEIVAGLIHDYPFLEPGHAERLVRLYGTAARKFLGQATKREDLGRFFGADLYEAELRFLAEREWASTGEDVLWRRTKLGLRLNSEQAEAVDAFIRDRWHNNRQATLSD